MLTLLLVVAAVAGGLAAPKPSDGEQRVQLLLEFKDFMVAMPMQKIYATVLDHMENDAQMQAALQYVQGKEFRQAVQELLARPSVKQLRMRYVEAGLDLERYEKMFADVVGGMTFSVPEDTTRSFGSFLEALDKLIPYEKLMRILDKKLEDSPVFIRFFRAITSQEMRMLVEKSVHSPEFKHVAQELEDMDVPVYQVLDVLYEIFAWKKQAEPNDL